MVQSAAAFPESLRIASYRFDLQAIEELYLPVFKGSTLRGGFGHAFKKMVCSQADWGACTPCKGGNDCPYGYIFETSLPQDAQALWNNPSIPRPFIIEPPQTPQQRFRPGEQLSFQLILIGKAINYLPYFLLTFEELGRMGLGNSRGRYVVQRIQALQPWENKHKLVYDGVDVRVGGEDLVLDKNSILLHSKQLSSNTINVHFKTPTLIMHKKTSEQRSSSTPVKSTLPFDIFIRTLLRRISMLSAFHCDETWETDFPALIALAQDVAVLSSGLKNANWQRYSSRQKRKLTMEGFMGEITYQGNLTPFLPLLAAGELLHVGKATVFGQGQYAIENL